MHAATMQHAAAIMSDQITGPSDLGEIPARMDYQRKYEEIVADYNREKDRTTIDETFRRLVELVNSLDEEQNCRRHLRANT